MTDSDPFSAVHPKFRSALLRRGFTELTKVQSAVLAAGAHGENLRISSETGSGKTVALGLVIGAALVSAPAGVPALPAAAGVETPALPVTSSTVAAEPSGAAPVAAPSVATPQKVMGPRALVITPTRELANQVAEELRWLYEEQRDVRVEVVTGGTDLRRDRQNLARNPTILVGTPGRLCDHLRSGALRCANVADVVLDEADQMLDMGFKDELDAIVLELPRVRRSHLVSATFPSQVRDLANRFQGKAVMIQGTELGVANADIEHVAHLVRPHEIYLALVNLLLLARGERTLIFVKRRIDAGEVSERLITDGFSALPLSGELPQAQRIRTLNAFRNGSVTTLVATDVAARGLDIPEISNVIHLEPPTDPEGYTHRSGRTGRAGRKGRSLSLVVPAAEGRVRRLLQAARVEASWQPAPSVAQIKKAVTKQGRINFYNFLKSGAEPSPADLEYAQNLLQKEDPVRVVAALLKLSEPVLPREPSELAPLASRQERAAPRRRSDEDFVRFIVNWGQRRGANPSRVLSMVCRRGNVTGDCIGAIEIDAHSTAFGVRDSVAARFETAVAKLDPSEPGMKIERIRAPEARQRALRQPSNEPAPSHAMRPYAPKPQFKRRNP